ncbi:MAG: HU family DNA-binding protein [Alphaproteobacteria bacterium]|nr:HU family DNA-binding protein [Alphaproteobacteria bacterium]
MNKMQLIDAVAKDAKVSKADVARVIASLLKVITAALKKGLKVGLIGFGTFYVTERKATEGRNPRTGAKLKIPARKRPAFKAGKSLKDTLNKK